MYKVALFGAGKIGEAICGLLTRSGRYHIKICDVDLTRAKLVADMWPNTSVAKLDLANKNETLALLKDMDAVLSALPFFCNPEVAELAVQAKTHYFDLTEDVKTTDKVAAIAKTAECALMPQCGLAPGFISVAAAYMASSFDTLDTIKMRVGALPIYPSNQLKYNLTWSTEGLINEYGNMCEVIYEGKKRKAFALECYEHFSWDVE